MTVGGLGSGLDFLYDENPAEVQGKHSLRISEIEPNRQQPRQDFDDAAIQELADSIAQHGVLQPLVVRPVGIGYQIVAGERRWRAARMAGLDEVPVVIRELTDQEALTLAMIENLQRENLNPMEEAGGYARLIEEMGMTQEQAAKLVGKSRSTVTNAMRLMHLPEEIQELVRAGQLSAGHARALLAIEDEETQIALAQRAAAGLLTVRAIERLAKAQDQPPAEPEKHRDSYYQEMQLSLENLLGRRVGVSYKKNRGTLTLEFYDKEDLAHLAKMLSDQMQQEQAD